MAWYLGLDEAAAQRRRGADCRAAGPSRAREMAGWLWDHGVSAVAADNMSLEAYPIGEGP